ncbi:endonuclease domain-containing protein [Pseudoclavibacter sp. RFBA6]|uniref:endonuclease domain-containing protein n=1 Tax=Pseudoclavibacter sp. RFBA6 TaxID=2080573 RepID=UPI000CE8A8A5|nr:DUF559 domain-containing protein [Pseudoclavibacter sp. RFBA6]PPG42293.1 hypothetical protein C5C17_04940 [Pseudoclavibacter sp. RFBA6]
MESQDEERSAPRMRAFTTRDGQSAGISARELYGGDYGRPHRGVFTTRPVESAVDYARAFAPRMRDSHALGDTTAARLWGLPLPRRLDAERTVHIVVPSGRNKPRGNDIRARSIQASNWARTIEFGLSLAPPPLTWALLARVLTTRELVTVGDALVTTSRSYRGINRPYDPAVSENPYSPVPPLAQLPELQAVTDSWGRTVGATRMRSALTFIRPGVESPMETLTRLAILEAGFPEPAVGYRVLDGAILIGRVDLAFPEAKVAVEYDGEYHWEKKQAMEDLARINRLQHAGWTVIRVTNRDLANPTAFFSQLRTALRRVRAS